MSLPPQHRENILQNVLTVRDQTNGRQNVCRAQSGLRDIRRCVRAGVSAGMATAGTGATGTVAVTIVATTIGATIMRGRRNRQRRAARSLCV